MSAIHLDVASLLDKLCAELGFCLSPDEKSGLCASPPLDIDSFTDAVFAAEGMDPYHDKQLRRAVRQRVAHALRQE